MILNISITRLWSRRYDAQSDQFVAALSCFNSCANVIIKDFLFEDHVIRCYNHHTIRISLFDLKGRVSHRCRYYVR